MKRIKKITAICLLVVMTSTVMVGFCCEKIYAKGKVKKIVVTKKVNLQVGQIKSIKVKIKTSGKVSKKYTVKTSKKGIVKVTKKNKKIVIKGLREGITKLTVKSKVNKKKKKVITVRVTKKNLINPVNDEIKLSVKRLGESEFILTFSKTVNVSDNNLTVKYKQTQKGDYIKSIPLADVTTNDKKTYVVVLHDRGIIKNGMWIQFTITGVGNKNIVYEIESYYSYDDQPDDIVSRFNIEDNIDDDFSLYLDDDDEGDSTVVHDKSITKVRNIPNGVSYQIVKDSTKVLFSGKITQPGIYNVFIDYENEMKTKYTQKMIWVVGSTSSIQVYIPNTKDGVYESHSDDVESQEASGTIPIYISGGSGDYKVKSKTSDEVFLDTPLPSKIDADAFEWEYYAEKPGNHKGVVEVIDKQDSTIRKTCEFSLGICQLIVLKGSVTTLSGKPIGEGDVVADPVGEIGDMFYGYAVMVSGKYVLFLMPGKYNIKASTANAYSYSLDKVVDEDGVLDFRMNVYELKLKPSREDVVFKAFETCWYDETESLYYGEGDKLYLRPGSYNLFTSAECFPAIEFEANAKFTINSDMSVVANITWYSNLTQVIYANETKKVSFNDEGCWLKFVATRSKSYTFYSANSNSKPKISLYDDSENYIDGDEGSGEDGNCELSLPLDAGSIYYLHIEPREELDGMMGHTDIFIK